MCFLRHFEERADSLYRQGLIHGPVHLGLGQEAVAVGAASVLRPDDYSLGTYRGHAHALARGAPPDAVLAELLGREGGICGGKGGSMHITSVEHGYYGSYAIVGAHLPIACGLAWAARSAAPGRSRCASSATATTNIGAFHEAVNLAAVWRLPVVFVCENNWYMEYTPIGGRDPGRAARRRPGRRLRAGPDRGGRQRRGRRPAGGRRRGPRGPGRAGPEPGRGADLPAQGALGRGRRRVPAGRGGGAVARAGPAAAHPGGAGRRRARPRRSWTRSTRGSRPTWPSWPGRCWPGPVPDPAGAWTDVWSDGSWQWRN